MGMEKTNFKARERMTHYFHRQIQLWGEEVQASLQSKKIVIIGGGAKNTYLNELTEKYTKLTVEAHPIEATAIGNLSIQMEEVKDEK